MISSRFVNELFDAIAGLVNQLTGKDIRFEKIEYKSSQESACEKVNKFSKAIAEALSNPTINVIGALEPGKLYVLQVDMSTVDVDMIENLVRGLNDKGIALAVIDQSTNFVSLPEGYELVKKE